MNAIPAAVDLAHNAYNALLHLEEAFAHEENAPPANTYQSRTHRTRPFDFAEYTDADSWNMFRFEKQELLRLHSLLYQGELWQRIDHVGLVSTLEAFCTTLRRLAFPVRLIDLEREFPRDMFALSRIINFTLDFLNRTWGHCLLLNPNALPEEACRQFSSAIHAAGAPFTNVIGFADGKFQRCARPSTDATQHEVYNGHKHLHGLKYHALIVPNGLLLDLHGPDVGLRNDRRLWTESGLDAKLQQLPFQGQLPYVVYADLGYNPSGRLWLPFVAPVLAPELQNANLSMSRVRVSVEWYFAIVGNHFSSLDFYRTQRLLQSPLGLMYRVAVLLTNLHNCFHPNQIALKFRLTPPSVEDYLNGVRFTPQ